MGAAPSAAECGAGKVYRWRLSLLERAMRLHIEQRVLRSSKERKQSWGKVSERESWMDEWPEELLGVDGKGGAQDRASAKAEGGPKGTRRDAALEEVRKHERKVETLARRKAQLCEADGLDAVGRAQMGTHAPGGEGAEGGAHAMSGLKDAPASKMKHTQLDRHHSLAHELLEGNFEHMHDSVEHNVHVTGKHARPAAAAAGDRGEVPTPSRPPAPHPLDPEGLDEPPASAPASAGPTIESAKAITAKTFGSASALEA